MANGLLMWVKEITKPDDKLRGQLRFQGLAEGAKNVWREEGKTSVINKVQT